jgi:hypothetical protein
MDDIRQDVTEKQLDAVAARVAELERKADALIKALSRPDVSARIGLSSGQVQEFTETFLTVQTAGIRHYNEREKAIRHAEKDRLFNRLRSEPGLAYPEARRKLAALERPVPSQRSPKPNRSTPKQASQSRGGRAR